MDRNNPKISAVSAPTAGVTPKFSMGLEILPTDLIYATTPGGRIIIAALTIPGLMASGAKLVGKFFQQ